MGSLGTPGTVLGRTGVILERLGSGPSFECLGAFLERVESVKGRLKRTFGRIFWRLGASSPPWGRLKRVFKRVGIFLEASWGILVGGLGHLGDV